MRSRFLLLLSLLLSLLSCNGQNRHIPAAVTTAAPIQIDRFDKELYRLVNTNDTSLQASLSAQYPQMLDVLGKGILNMQSVQTPGFFNKLVHFYSEPTLKGLYQDAIRKYEQTAEIEQALGNSFAWLKSCFPNMQIPAIYMHVSGFNQNVLVGDSLLSLSIDKYMGDDYPLYQDFFYDYQRIGMTHTQVVPDYLAGWLMAEYPFAGKENVLLDRMIYEGKIKYLIHGALPDLTPRQLMCYTENAYNWCQENESNLWKAIIERKQLYTPDQLATAKYFELQPCTFLVNEAPGNVGTWIGWQIVDQYMKETNSTPEALMQNTNSQEILAASKYKP